MFFFFDSWVLNRYSNKYSLWWKYISYSYLPNSSILINSFVNRCPSKHIYVRSSCFLNRHSPPPPTPPSCLFLPYWMPRMELITDSLGFFSQPELASLVELRGSAVKCTQKLLTIPLLRTGWSVLTSFSGWTLPPIVSWYKHWACKWYNPALDRLPYWLWIEVPCVVAHPCSLWVCRALVRP